MTYENNIDGYVVMSQLLWLKDRAEEMDSIIEIGSWKGRSGHALLSGCKGMVYLIDTFKGTAGEMDYFKDKDAYEQCVENLKDFKNKEILKMTSSEAVSLVPEVDMVWIDGDHSYEGCKRDIEMYLPKAKKLICGHDFGRDVIKRAVKETLGDVEVFGAEIWYKWL